MKYLLPTITMVTMKIVYIIFLCTGFKSTEAAENKLVRLASSLSSKFNFPDISNYFRSPPPTPSLDGEIGVERDVDIEDDIPDLNNFQSGELESFDYFKSVMLLYCAITEERFFVGQHLKFESIEKLEKLEKKSDTEDSSPFFQELTDLTVDIIHYYCAHMRATAYLDRAYYHNSLLWLQKHMYPNSKASDLINEIKVKKTRNYLNEFIPPQKIAAFFDEKDNKFKRIDGWRENDAYSEALDFIERIMELDDETAKKIEMKHKDLELYESIFIHATPYEFQQTMKKEIWEVHVRINKRLDFESKKNPKIKSPLVKGLIPKDIDLEKIPKGTIRYYKHVGILFIEAVEQRLSMNIFSAEIREELTMYPEGEQERNKTRRYCTFQQWFSTLIQAIVPKFSENDNSKNLIYRLTIFRLLQWFRIQTLEKNTNTKICNDALDTVRRFEEKFSFANPIFTDTKTYKSITTLDALLKEGVEEDFGINTISQIVFVDKSSFLQHCQQELADLKLKKPEEQDSQQIINYSYIEKTTQSEINFITSYLGKPQSDSMLQRSPGFYENLIDNSRIIMLYMLAATFAPKDADWFEYYNQLSNNPEVKKMYGAQ